jgi:hypothetical protein
MIQVPQIKIADSVSETGNNNVELGVSFSALHFLRAYNRLMSPSGKLLKFSFHIFKEK